MPTPEHEIMANQLDRFDKANWKDELPEDLNSAVDITARVCELPDESPNNQVKLTKPMIRDIAKAMARYSMSLEDSAALVGIDRDTISAWCNANKTLSGLFSRARARGQKDLAAALLCHDQLSERGIIFMLERRHSHAFAQKSSLEVSGSVNHFHIPVEQSKQLEASWQAFEARHKPQVIQDATYSVIDEQSEPKAQE